MPRHVLLRLGADVNVEALRVYRFDVRCTADSAAQAFDDEDVQLLQSCKRGAVVQQVQSSSIL